MSTVTRTAGVDGTFTYTLTVEPDETPSMTIYDDPARTSVAVAAAELTPTANPSAFTASYPSTLAAGTYWLAFSTVITTGQPAIVDADDTLTLVDASGDVGSELDILTIDEAFAALNITGTTEQNEVAGELAQVVTAASGIVDGIFGPVVTRATSRTWLAPDGDLWLDIPAGSRTMNVALTAVTEYTAGASTVLTAESATVAGGYRLDASLGRVIRRQNFTGARWGDQEVTISYTIGRYPNTATVHPIFKEAAASVVMHLWQRRGSQSGFGAAAGEGAPFSGVPYSMSTLRKQLVAQMPDEALADLGHGIVIA